MEESAVAVSSNTQKSEPNTAAPAVVPLYRYVRDNLELAGPELMSFAITLLEVIALLATLGAAIHQVFPIQVNGVACAESGHEDSVHKEGMNRVIWNALRQDYPGWESESGGGYVSYVGHDFEYTTACGRSYVFVQADKVPKRLVVDGVTLDFSRDYQSNTSSTNWETNTDFAVESTFGLRFRTTWGVAHDCVFVNTTTCYETHIVSTGWNGSACYGRGTIQRQQSCDERCCSMSVGGSTYHFFQQAFEKTGSCGISVDPIYAGLVARSKVRLKIDVAGYNESVTRRKYACAQTRTRNIAACCYWFFRFFSAAAFLRVAVMGGLLRKPMAAPLAYSMQAASQRGAMVRIGISFFIVFPALTAVNGIPAGAKVVFYHCFVASCGFAAWACYYGNVHGIFGIMNIYVSASLMIGLTLIDLIVGTQGETVTAVILAVVQALLAVRELMRYTTGGYISYYDNGAYIRATDELTFKMIKERKIPWNELLGSTFVYTAPLRQSSDVVSHMDVLLSTLSDGPLKGAEWFAATGAENDEAKTEASLVIMPVTDRTMVGRGDDKLVYYCLNRTWYAANADGEVEPRSPTSELMRLSAPALVR
jgi:hypothetical protein